MTTDFGKVAVLMGGHSAEREISLKSGRAVLAALLRQGIDAVAIDTAHEWISQLTTNRFDRVFIALHGRGGEDGVIQGLLDSLGLPYTGSGVLGAALAMDKYRTKLIWQGSGLPTPPSQLLKTKLDLNQVFEKLGLPLMVKPVLEGSSVGMSKVNRREELESAWETAAQYHCDVLVERYITGSEYTASILNDTVLPLIRLETPRDFYDFAAKYHDPHTNYICPCGLPPAQEQSLQQLVKQAFLAINASGWGRVDFICDQTGQPWLLEVNTIPGMTDHSLVPMAAKTAGITFDELVLRILATTWTR
jgi:D-alanine-D-alanine ligase